MFKKKNKEEVISKIEKQRLPLNMNLANMVTPMGVKIAQNSITIGENIGRVYGIIKYPNEVNYGWISKFTNIPGAVTCITFNPINSGEFLKKLSNMISYQRGIFSSTKDQLTKTQAETAAKNAEKIMIQIDQSGEMIGELGITVMPLVRDEEQLRIICQRIQNIMIMERCKIRSLANLQKEAFETVSPFYTGNSEIDSITGRIMPVSTFMGGFPFASSGFCDSVGYKLGSDHQGGLIIVDHWERSGDRTNSNIVILGKSGTGKSTLSKDIIMMEFALGTKIIIFDPETEYKELVENFKENGAWINVGGDPKNRINPLQVSVVEEDEEGKRISPLVLHLNNLEVFFSFYLPDLSEIDNALLKSALLELYNQFGMTWDSNYREFKNTDYPIFEDLYQLFLKKSEDPKENEADEYRKLALLIKSVAEGADRFLWGGHTTINTNAQCICLDTGALKNTTKRVKGTQYYNLLSWAEEKMFLDRNEKYLMVVDEAHLMIDPGVPQTMSRLQQFEKRARKYEGGLMIISHSPVDFLDERVKMYGQALLDQPTYKYIFGCDGKDLEETKRLYNLTEAQTELLEAQLRGRCLFFCGSKRMELNVEVPEYKIKYMGKAGGR